MTMLATPNRVSNSADLLQAASPHCIQLALLTIPGRNRWLTAQHRYADVAGALWPPSVGVDGVPLAEYIAYSIPLHVADGWTFLARALDSVKAGDIDSAIHMAYYAELRAAMSLLATEGVGVFDRRHVAIGSNYAITDLVNQGTHRVVWELLSAWGSDPGRSPTILDAIRVEQRTISDWLQVAQISQSVQHVVAGNWLNEWSVDLQRFSKDREARNEVSYRPHRLVATNIPVPGIRYRVVDPLLRIWDSLEPSPDLGGVALDTELLARALSYAFDRPSRSIPEWEHFVDQNLQPASGVLKATLKGPLANSGRIFSWAQQSSFPPTANAIIARATLLLRIANAVCAQLLHQLQITRMDLEFWWQPVGEEYGLWSNGYEPVDFADLWWDVEDAIVRIENTVGQSNSLTGMSPIHSMVGTEVTLTQYSRALFWLLGLT